MTDDTGNVGDALKNAVSSPDGAKTFADSAKHMLGEAQSGRWAVDEETGTHLRRAISHAADQLSRLEYRVQRLQQAPKLGNDSYAVTVAEHMRKAMDSDDQSLVPVFRMLTAGLSDLTRALDTAMQNYAAADETATHHLAKFKDG